MLPWTSSASPKVFMCSGARGFLGCKGWGRRADLTSLVEGCHEGLDDASRDGCGARDVFAGGTGDTYCRSS